MMKIITLILVLLLPISILAQKSDCERMLRDASVLAQKKDFQKAINKYTAAATCNPKLQKQVNDSINRVFRLVEAEKEKAIRNEKEANRQKALVIKQQDSTEMQRKIAEAQRDSARLERDIAETNRIAAVSLNVKGTDPNLALRIAEVAYNRHNPPLSDASLSLSSIFYDFFDTKTFPYEKEIKVNGIDFKEAWLTANNNGVIFNEITLYGEENTYFVNLSNDSIKNLTEKYGADILNSTDKNLFITNFNKFKNTKSKNRPITLWNSMGEKIKNLEIKNDSIKRTWILPNNNKIIAQTQNNKIVLFDSKGQLEKTLDSTNLNIFDNRFSTDNGKYFFTISTRIDLFHIWDSDGNLIKVLNINKDFNIEDISASQDHILIKRFSRIELVNLEIKNKNIILEGSINTDKDLFFFNLKFSPKGTYIIGHRSYLGNLNQIAKESYNNTVIWNQFGKIEKISSGIFEYAEFSQDERYLMTTMHNEYLTEENGEKMALPNDDSLKIWALQNNKISEKPITGMKIVRFSENVKPIFLIEDYIMFLSSYKELMIYNWRFSKGEKIIIHNFPITEYFINRKKQLIISKDRQNTKITNFEGDEKLNIFGEKGITTNTKYYEDRILSYNKYGQYRNTIKIWKHETELYQLLKHGGSIDKVLISNDESRILSVGCNIKLWSKQGNLIKDIWNESSQECFKKAKFLNNSNSFITWSDSTITLWDKEGNIIKENSLIFNKHEYDIKDVFFAPKNTFFYTYNLLGEVVLWNTILLKPLDIINLEGYASFGYQSFSKNKLIMQCLPEKGSKLILWKDLTHFKDTIHLEEANEGGRVSFSKNEDKLISRYRKGQGAIWRTDNGKKIIDFPQNENLVEGILFSHNDSKAISFLGNKIYLWNIATVPTKITIEVGYKIKDACTTPDNNYIIVTTYSLEMPLLVYDFYGNMINKNNSHKGIIESIVFSENGKYFITSTGKASFNINPSSDYTVKLWTVKGEMLADFNKHTGDVHSFGFLREGDYIYTGSSDGTIKIFPTPYKIIQWLKEESTISPLTEDEKTRYGIKNKK